MCKSKSSQASFTQRMRNEHTRRAAWIDKALDKKLCKLARTKNWINTTGSKTGQPNMQRTLIEVISAGVKQLEK
jgi:hypothetical protein